MRTVHANTGEVSEARRFAKAIRRFLHVVIVTVHTQTVVIFTQLFLSKLRDVVRSLSFDSPSATRAVTPALPYMAGRARCGDASSRRRRD